MELDWKIAAICVMLTLGAYNVLLRKYFKAGEDWRAFIPIVFIASLVLLAYFVYSFKEIKFTQDTIPLLLVTMLFGGAVVFFSTLVFMNPGTQLNVAVPVMSLATLVTVVLGVTFLGEQITIQKAAGIVLALISIFLLAF